MHFSRPFTCISAIVGAVYLLGANHSVGAEAPAQVVATGYFVDCKAGSDSNAGTSQSAPWLTLAKVKASVTKTGSDVWLKAGTVCEDQQLAVDWSGTSSDHAIIGVYYVSGGVAYQNVPADVSGLPVDYVYDRGARAEINGTVEASCGFECAVDAAAAVPKTHNEAIVRVGGNYVDVQDLQVMDSAGVGVVVNPFQNHVTLQRLVIDRTMSAFIQANSSEDLIVRDSYMTNWGLYEYLFPSGPNPAALSLTNGNDWTHVNRMLIENNDVAIGRGEGIDPLFGANTVIIRGNRVGGTSSPCVYIEGRNVVVEYNICEGGSNSGGVGTNGVGIKFAYEDFNRSGHEPMTGNLVRGNLVVNNDTCFSAGLEPLSAGDPTHNFMEIEYYNNTCVSTSTGTAVGFEYLAAANIGPKGIVFRNNILYVPSSKRAGGCFVPNSSSRLIFARNLWPSTPDADCQGAGDVIGDPRLTRMDYTAAKWNAVPTFGDAAPKDTSPARAAGMPIAKAIADLSLQTHSSRVRYPCAKWDAVGAVLDARCATRSATAPNIGASEDAGGAALALSLTVD